MGEWDVQGTAKTWLLDRDGAPLLRTVPLPSNVIGRRMALVASTMPDREQCNMV